MNKKGFTLIELLAVIVVLALILIVAVPKILNVIDIAKRETFILNQKMIIKATEKYLLLTDNKSLEIGEQLEVSINYLKSNNLITNIKSPYDQTKECGGYVFIKKIDEKKYDYSVNLDCFNNFENSTDDKLQLYYKFNDYQEPTVNEFTYPNFETSQNTGGWSHWGSSGVIGEYGQNTNKEYIYGDQTYSHYISADVSSPHKYLLYKSPAFDGGYRSLTAIIKMSDSSEIIDSKIHPTWNSPTGLSIPNNKWTSIESLGNGFYLCKAEAINQSGTNNLVGIYVSPGNKAYVSFMQLEQKSYATPLVIGKRTGTIKSYTTNINDSILSQTLSPRWINNGYYFNGFNNEISLPNNLISTEDIRLNGLTYSLWIKPESLKEQRIIGQQIGDGYSDYSNGGIGITSNGKAKMIAYSDANPSAYLSADSNTTLSLNKWTHIVGVYDNIDKVLKIYINGKLDSTPVKVGVFSRLSNVEVNRIGKKEHNTPYYYNGYLDEVRIYNRVLNDNEIKSIYEYESTLFNFN